MEKTNRQMHLGAFLLNCGHHIAAWRHRGAYPEARLDLDYYTHLAHIAERGKFDLVFLSDFLGIQIPYKNNEELSRWGNMARFEPFTLLSALSTQTKKIGLVATGSTTYNEPFCLARTLASIDFISDGRAGWNVVTSASENEAKNCNLKQQLDHTTRYRRADEFMKVVTGLWDSWEDDAFLFDKVNGRHFDTNKLRTLDHEGEFFSVKGPLNIARSPQGYPVIVQAGSSVEGSDFAAKWAELVFTAHQQLEQAQQFYARMKKQVIHYGRDPANIKIMPGIMPIIANTKKAAKEKYAELQELIDEQLALSLLSGLLGEVADLSELELDKPLPALSITQGNQSRQALIYQESQQEGLTLRQLYKNMVGARGHYMVFGSALEVADELEYWFTHDAADGFNIMPACLPADLSDFVELVIPELQNRGLFREEYEGNTLREHLGLPRPTNQFVLKSFS